MALIKFGNISEVIPAEGKVRVEFPENEMVSGLLPVLVSGSKDNKYFHTFDIGEHVVCLMDQRCENGVVLGAIYDKNNTPESGTNEDVSKVTFSDGTKVEYNRTTSLLEINVQGTKIKASPSGVEISTATDNLKDILDKMVSIEQSYLPLTTSPGNPTVINPLAVPEYTALILRISNLLTI